MAESGLPPFPAAAPGGLWNARSSRIPYVEPWPVEASRTCRLEFASGRVVVIAVGSGLLGRAPQDAGGDVALQFVRVDDPGRSVSKVHAGFEFDGVTLWIEDRDSANGTAIVREGGQPRALVPWQRQAAEPGEVVRIGRQSFTVH